MLKVANLIEFGGEAILSDCPFRNIYFGCLFRLLTLPFFVGLLLLANAAPSNAQQVEVFLVARPADGIAKALRKQAESNAPQEIAKLRSSKTNSISGNEREHTVVFYANRKLPIGTQIKIEHQFKRPGMGKLQPYAMKYMINAKNQSTPFVILNKSKAGGRGGSIEYKIFINNKLSGSKAVQIR